MAQAADTNLLIFFPLLSLQRSFFKSSVVSAVHWAHLFCCCLLWQVQSVFLDRTASFD